MANTEYWEPNAEKLVVGARVRVRGFSECPWQGRSVAMHKSRDTVCHRGKDIGYEGEIVETNFSDKHSLGSGHRFLIKYSDPTLSVGHYAAIELEPIEEEQ